MGPRPVNVGFFMVKGWLRTSLLQMGLLSILNSAV